MRPLILACCISFFSFILFACSQDAPTLAPNSPTASKTRPPDTATPTITPSPTTTPSPTSPVASGLSGSYQSEALSVSVFVPDGWAVGEVGRTITLSDLSRKIDLVFFEQGELENDPENPIAALESYIWFVSYPLPDKEVPHLVDINGSEIAFASYFAPGPLDFGFTKPKFLALYFAEDFTILAEFSVLGKERAEDWELFESVLASLPPSVSSFGSAAPTSTPTPGENLVLPTSPEGVHWMGVDSLEFAIPVPDGWFVRFTDVNALLRNPNWDYFLEYYLTPEDPVFSGTFTSVMVISVIKDDSADAAEKAAEFFDNRQNGFYVYENSDSSMEETGSWVTYQASISSTNTQRNPDDPFYSETSRLVVHANKSTNEYVVIEFESPAATWEKQWVTGQIVLQLLIDLLQRGN